MKQKKTDHPAVSRFFHSLVMKFMAMRVTYGRKKAALTSGFSVR